MKISVLYEGRHKAADNFLRFAAACLPIFLCMMPTDFSFERVVARLRNLCAPDEIAYAEMHLFFSSTAIGFADRFVRQQTLASGIFYSRWDIASSGEAIYLLSMHISRLA